VYSRHEYSRRGERSELALGRARPACSPAANNNESGVQRKRRAKLPLQLFWPTAYSFFFFLKARAALPSNPLEPPVCHASGTSSLSFGLKRRKLELSCTEFLPPSIIPMPGQLISNLKKLRSREKDHPPDIILKIDLNMLLPCLRQFSNFGSITGWLSPPTLQRSAGGCRVGRNPGADEAQRIHFLTKPEIRSQEESNSRPGGATRKP
jgi:hypothetical protein